MKLDGEKRTDVVVSHAASSWQKKPAAWIVLQCVFLCVRGRVQEREPTGFNVPWHVLLGWGVAFVDEVCGHVHPGALQEADDLCDNWCLCLPLSTLRDNCDVNLRFMEREKVSGQQLYLNCTTRDGYPSTLYPPSQFLHTQIPICCLYSFVYLQYTWNNLHAIWLPIYRTGRSWAGIDIGKDKTIKIQLSKALLGICRILFV